MRAVAKCLAILTMGALLARSVRWTSSKAAVDDDEYQFGVMIPVRGWTLDADNFRTKATNWLDHNNIGESNLFWPITWDAAVINGWGLTLRSPGLWRRGRFHLAYSNQIAEATSPITGGLICPAPVTTACGLDVPPGFAPVDHDQRNKLNFGYNTTLPWRAYTSAKQVQCKSLKARIVRRMIPRLAVIPRRRQAAALQGAFGTRVFRPGVL